VRLARRFRHGPGGLPRRDDATADRDAAFASAAAAIPQCRLGVPRTARKIAVLLPRSRPCHFRRASSRPAPQARPGASTRLPSTAIGLPGVRTTTSPRAGTPRRVLRFPPSVLMRLGHRGLRAAMFRRGDPHHHAVLPSPMHPLGSCPYEFEVPMQSVRPCEIPSCLSHFLCLDDQCCRWSAQTKSPEPFFTRRPGFSVVEVSIPSGISSSDDGPAPHLRAADAAMAATRR
jgi:hypothetical protein